MGQAAQQSVASAAEIPHAHKRGRCRGAPEGEADERPPEGEAESHSTATEGSRGPAPSPRGLDEEHEDAWEAFRAKRVLVDPGMVMGDGTGPVLFSLPSPSPSPSPSSSPSPAPRTLPDGAHFVIASMLDLPSRLCVCLCSPSLLDPYRAHLPSLTLRSPPPSPHSPSSSSSLVSSLLTRHTRLQHLTLGARSLPGLSSTLQHGGLAWLHSLHIHAEQGASQQLLLPLLQSLSGKGEGRVGLPRLRVLRVAWRVEDKGWKALVDALAHREARRRRGGKKSVCKPLEGLSVDWVRAPGGAGGGAGRPEVGEEGEEEEEEGEGEGEWGEGRKGAYTFHMYSTTRRLSPSTYLRYGQDSYSAELLEGEGMGRRHGGLGMAMGDPLCRLLLTSPACYHIKDLHLLAELTPIQAGMVVDFLRQRGQGGRPLMRRLGLWGDAACGMEDLGGALINALLQPHSTARAQQQQGEGVQCLELRGFYLSGGPMEALAQHLHSHAHAAAEGHAPPLQLQVLRLQCGSLRSCDLRHFLQLPPPSCPSPPRSPFPPPPPQPVPLPSLKVLDLSCNSLGLGEGEDLGALAAAIEDGAMPRLEELVLSGNPSLGDEGLGIVLQGMAKGTQHMQHLHTLALARCTLTSVGVSLLSGSLYAPHATGGRVCPQLHTLDLSGNVVGRVGCAALGTAMCRDGGLEGLSSLRLSGAKGLGDEGAKYLLRPLAGAQAPTGGVSLVQLDLSYCGLGARGLQEVGMAMAARALPRLQELSLAGNDDKEHEEEGEITGEGVGAVVRALASGAGQALTWLNLAFARLHEEEALQLAQVLECGGGPRLRHVVMTGTGIDWTRKTRVAHIFHTGGGWGWGWGGRPTTAPLTHCTAPGSGNTRRGGGVILRGGVKHGKPAGEGCKIFLRDDE